MARNQRISHHSTGLLFFFKSSNHNSCFQENLKWLCMQLCVVFQKAGARWGLSKKDFLAPHMVTCYQFCFHTLSCFYHSVYTMYIHSVKKLCSIQLLNTMISSTVDEHPSCQCCGNTWDIILLNGPEKPPALQQGSFHYDQWFTPLLSCQWFAIPSELFCAALSSSPCL